MPGPGEWGAKRPHVGCLVCFPKPPSLGIRTRTLGDLGGPSSSLGIHPPDSPAGLQGGLLAIASLLRLVSYILVSFPAEKITTSLHFCFAEIITDFWLLGLFKWQTMMTVMINARVKTFCWACVSFYNLTHSLHASISSSVLGLGFVTNLAGNASCLLFLELRVRISNVILRIW